MIRLVERSEVSPICPHCEAQIREVCFQRISGMGGKRFLYYCPSCSKVLGVSHRKGFWMG